uniref:KIAA0513 n=1 Tax=Callorhinchus milii TaxID=7868 RepID=V9KLB2_CALMI|eukprot:gi/632978794/ref/XP_007906114.1/ PREDICTED: uncharacterized protein KIAA0513 homolog [Callorhinchus milii]
MGTPAASSPAHQRLHLLGSDSACVAPNTRAMPERLEPDRSSDSTGSESESELGDYPTLPSQDNGTSSDESFSSHQSSELLETAERREFMRKYVEKIFSGGEAINQEEKARFGVLCSEHSPEGREWFAKHVSAQRCNSKCVSEHTFYRLVQSFAVVLFECFQMDDYSPAKNLMTMCFTFYHVAKPCVSVTDLREKPAAPIDSYLRTANSWLAGKRDLADKLLRNKENVKAIFGGRETRLKQPQANSGSAEPQARKRSRKTVKLGCGEEQKGEKVYLYTHLKTQPIWHTLRFWNAAFFDAVHCERRKRSPTTRERWSHMTAEERDDSLRFNENIAFGQLGTFTHNMLAFGLSQKLCNDFLKKQAVIGNLNEEQYQLLCNNIQQMAVE